MSQAPDRPIPSQLVRLRSLVRLARFWALRSRTQAQITVGENVWFGAGAVLAAPDYVSIGNNVAFGRAFHLETNLVVGDDVLVSSRVACVGNDHRCDEPDTTLFWQGRTPADTIILEGDNLIGFGTVLVGTITVGRGTVVGAGSVVTRDLPSGYVCAGCPARPLRRRHAGREDEP